MSTAERPRFELPSVHLRPITLSDEARQNWGRMRDEARFTAVLRPDLPDFISLPWANKPESGEFSSKFQRMAAEIVTEAFSEVRPDIVLGIGNSGIPFAGAVTEQVRKKSTALPKIGFGEIRNLAGYTGELVSQGTIFEAHSYSRGEVVRFNIPPIGTGKKVLVIDDVSAKGSISIALVQQLQKMGIDVVGLGVYFNKDWQGGLSKFTEVTGVPSFSVIRIASVDEAGIKLTPKEEALARFEKTRVTPQQAPHIAPVPYPTDDIQLP